MTNIGHKCRICKNEDLSIILDYGKVALSDSFLNDFTKVKEEKKYPLRLCFCNYCRHVQIDETLDPLLLFQNYVFTGGEFRGVPKLGIVIGGAFQNL